MILIWLGDLIFQVWRDDVYFDDNM